MNGRKRQTSAKLLALCTSARTTGIDLWMRYDEGYYRLAIYVQYLHDDHIKMLHLHILCMLVGTDTNFGWHVSVLPWTALYMYRVTVL